MCKRIQLRALPVIAMLLVSCSGGRDNPTSPKTERPVVTTLSFVEGGGQTARKGTAVPVVPVLVAKDQKGAPIGGVTINFTVSAGGSILVSSTVTGVDGTASVGRWTLSPQAGQNTIAATAVGGINPTTQITATGRNPLWTVMVYMAADNDLAREGIRNIDQMEDAGPTPELQIVLQAEFSASTLAQIGCGSSCFNRPNFNTFRYVVSPGPSVPGPNAPVQDIGNRNMTDPAQLNEFIAYAKQTTPAEHYLLILWNHGNGYQGLFVDEGSSPGTMMTLNQLSAAFNGSGPIDVMGFDMCLMGGYETLTKIAGTASYAVFSENEVPGPGYPYQRIVSALGGNPSMSPASAATIVAENFDAYYAGFRSSTTVSAYDLGGFASFEAALGNLAATLKVNLSGMSQSIGSSASLSQAFEFPPVKDLGDFLDSLSVRTTDGLIATQINSVRQSAAAFRLRSRARNGSDPKAINVSRASGLSILMPSGVGRDRLDATGPGSLAAYQATVGNRPWGELITAWMANKQPLGFTDMGPYRFESYLVWDQAAVASGADVDFFVLEPNGDLWGPAFGTVSPNGLFSGDSYNSKSYYEGYQMERYVETGVYRFYAFLWTDPGRFSPAYNLYYRNLPTVSFQTLYASPFPRLSMTKSIASDPTPTPSEIDSFQYTDFRPVATLTIPANASASMNFERKDESSTSGVRANVSVGGQLPAITPAQMSVIRDLIAGRRKRENSEGGLKPPVKDFLR